jgi:hypothetical protein
MKNGITVYVAFFLLTLISFAAWWLTDSEFAGGIAGNMSVGFITLVSVNLVIDASLERARRPAVAASIKVAATCHGLAVKTIMTLYGAGAHGGFISREEHRAIRKDDLVGLASLLAKVPVRATAFVSPPQPSIVCMYRDCLELRREIHTALASYGLYLPPAVAANLSALSTSSLLNFVTTAVEVQAVPERFSENDFRDMLEVMNSLRASISDTDKALGDTLYPTGYFHLLEQPGVFKA